MSSSIGKVPKRPNRRLIPFFRTLGPRFGSFEGRGTDLVQTPIGLFYATFSFEPKEGMPDARWLQPTSIPLFLPTDLRHLCYGLRIPQNPKPGLASFWVYLYNSEVEPALDARRVIHEIGLPMLSRLNYARGFLEFIEAHNNRKCDCFSFDRAGLLAYLQRSQEAILSLEYYQELLNRTDSRWPNQKALLERTAEERRFALRLEALIRMNDYDALLEQFKQWREDNIERFGLEDMALTWEEALKRDRLANELHTPHEA